METSIILPIYNEKENLRPLLEEIESVFGRSPQEFEVIAVDDASTDGSRQLIEQLAAEKPYLKAVFLRSNSGQSAAFDAGFRHCGGKIVVTMDADRQNDPRDVPRMISMIRDGHDFVTGWRRDRKDGWLLRTLPSRIANWIIRRVTGTRIHDLGCSLKVYRKEIVNELRLYGEMHRFISVLAEGVGARIGELEVNHRPRVAGVSKYGLSRTFKVLLDLLTVWFMKSYRTKPIYVFGGFGGGLLLAGAVSAALVLYEKVINGIWVHRNPLFILSVMFTVIGVQFLGMGLIAEIIIRIYFESRDRPAYSVAKTLGFEQPNEAPQISRIA